MSDYPRTLMATLIRKTGEKGSYFVGFAGPMMITLSKLPEPDDQGRECWALKCSNPPKKQKPEEWQRQQQQDIDRELLLLLRALTDETWTFRFDGCVGNPRKAANRPDFVDRSTANHRMLESGNTFRLQCR